MPRSRNCLSAEGWATHFSASIAPPCLWAVAQFAIRFRQFLPQLFQMTRKILTSLLLLLICGSVAAEPHKQRRTAATPRAAKTQHNNTTSKEPSAEETSVKEPPANELFGAAPGPAPLTARAIGSYARGALLGR